MMPRNWALTVSLVLGLPRACLFRVQSLSLPRYTPHLGLSAVPRGSGAALGVGGAGGAKTTQRRSRRSARPWNVSVVIAPTCTLTDRKAMQGNTCTYWEALQGAIRAALPRLLCHRVLDWTPLHSHVKVTCYCMTITTAHPRASPA